MHFYCNLTDNLLEYHQTKISVFDSKASWKVDEYEWGADK